jgi:short-subunit dehydrogenase
MNDWLRDIFQDRPWWMNILLVFSGYMAFVYVPWDLFFKPVESDVEVWFGISFTGWAAKLMALPHWFVYGAAVYGFRRRRPWMRFWGAAYSAQVAFAMFVWSLAAIGGFLGLFAGLLSAIPFSLIALGFWNAQDYFEPAGKTLRERYGEWALVTGASAGIGAEFARALAAEGLSVVLTARREERLRDLAAELEDKFAVSTRTIALDLAAAEGPTRLLAAVDDLEIGILVANAGVGYAGRVDKQEPARLEQLLALNCRAPMLLVNRLTPKMLERKRGAVIITGSAAGHQPIPYHAAYAASKAFVLFLGEALSVELRDQGVDVLVLEPGSVASEFQAAASEIDQGGEPPAAPVQEALASLGLSASVLPGWWVWLRANLAQRLGSRRLTAYFARDFMRPRTPPDMR